MQIPFFFYLNLLAIIIWGVIRRRSLVELYLLGFYFIGNFLFEAGAWLYSYYTYRSNHWIFNVFTTLQIMYMSYLYSRILVSERLKRVIPWFLGIYPFIVLTNVIVNSSYFRFHTYSYIPGCIFLILLIFAYFNQLMHSTEIIQLRRIPWFWVNIGNTIFFVGSIFYLGSVNFILESGHDNYGDLIQLFVYSFTSIQYICFIIALLCNLRPEPN